MSGLSIRLLERADEMRPLAVLLGSVWNMPPDCLEISPDMLRALVFTDNYVAGAFIDGQLVGGAVGFWGRDPDGPILHSHVTGIVPTAAGSGVGFQLKQHQRAWTLAHDVRRITWTFDPLVRRNAYFNLVKLGAYFDEYHEHFYDEMHDPINAGDETDRVVAIWDLDGVSTPVVEHDTVSIEVPADIVALRETDTRRALDWRRRTREQFQRAFEDGYRAVSIAKDGHYTLARKVLY